MARKAISGFFKRAKKGLGFTFSGSGLLPDTQRDGYHANRPRLDDDIVNLVSRHKHRIMLADGRFIYQSSDTVAGAVHQKSRYVYGRAWRLKYDGEADDFRDAVHKLFRRIDGVLDVRGAPFSFRKNIRIASKLLDVDGEFFILLTEAESGFPRLQFLESHRIGQPKTLPLESEIEAGPYKGLMIRNGIIYNKQAHPVAYRLMLDEENFEDISARDMIHVYDPVWFSQGRGIPPISYGLLSFYDLKESRDLQRIKQKVHSALTLIESNEQGKTDTGRQAVGGYSPVNRQLQTELIEGGMIRYIRNGNKIQPHTANDPSNGQLEFDKLVESRALYGINWRREMVDSSEVGGAGVRAFQSDINGIVFDRGDLLLGAWTRAAVYIVAKFEKLRVAGSYDPGWSALPSDWFELGFSRPARFTVDDGKYHQEIREDIRAGLLSVPEACEMRNLDAKAILSEQADYLDYKKQLAEERGLDPDELGTFSKPGDAPPGASAPAVDESD
ncbi:MAG: phage portal protein [Verrucomicrobiota bacterium]